LDNNFDQKIEDLIMIIDQKLEEHINLLDQKFQEQVNDLTEKLSNHVNSTKLITNGLEDKIDNLTKDVSINLQNIQDQIKTQKNENISMNNDFNELITKTTSKIDTELEQIKGQQDVLKVSFDVLDKKILEDAKTMIFGEVRMACKDKEDEILMNIWIEELKEIINDFDKLKELNPKELKIQIDEISQVIASFKKRLA